MSDNTTIAKVRFVLTDHEVADLARKRAALESEMGGLEVLFTAAKDKHKAAVSKLESEVGVLSGLIRDGYELRDTRCRVEWDYVRGVVETVNDETGEVVQSRELTPEEKSRRPLPLEDREPASPTVLLDPDDPDVKAAEASEAGIQSDFTGEDLLLLQALDIVLGEPLPQPWAAAVEGGISNMDLRHAIGSAFGDGGGLMQNGASIAFQGGAKPKVWFGTTSPYGAPPLSGSKLTAKVRALLGLPMPDRPSDQPESAPEDAEAESVNDESTPVNGSTVSANTEPVQNLDARDPGYEPPDPARAEGPDCLTCGHVARIHGDPRVGRDGCMMLGCSCTHYVHPDPLGVNDYDPRGEGQEVGDATP